MENGKMVNVKGAAIMHNGEWLKISDRDEVNNLKNQVSNLNSQLNYAKSDEWLMCPVSHCTEGRVLYNVRTQQMVGTIVNNFNPDSYDDMNIYNGHSTYIFCKIQPPLGYRFDGNTTIFNAYSDSRTGIYMKQSDSIGSTLIVFNDSNDVFNRGPVYGINSYVRTYKL